MGFSPLSIWLLSCMFICVYIYIHWQGTVVLLGSSRDSSEIGESCHKIFTDFLNFEANFSSLSESIGMRVIDPLEVADRIWNLASLVGNCFCCWKTNTDSQLLFNIWDLEEFPAAQDFDLKQYVGNSRAFWSSLVEQEWYWYSNAAFSYMYQYCKKHLL